MKNQNLRSLIKMILILLCAISFHIQATTIQGHIGPDNRIWGPPGSDPGWVQVIGDPFIEVEDDVTVPADVDLFILAGTVIKVSAGKSITVTGGIIAPHGVEGDTIRFTSNYSVAGSWAGFRFLASPREKRLRTCVIEYAQTGIKCSEVEQALMSLTNSVIRYNTYGVEASQGGGKFFNSSIMNNDMGLRIGYNGRCVCDNAILLKNDVAASLAGGANGGNARLEGYSTTFIENNWAIETSVNGYGGGSATIILENCVVSQNHNGGIYYTAQGHLSNQTRLSGYMTDCQITNNNGPGLEIYSAQGAFDYRIEKCEFTLNRGFAIKLDGRDRFILTSNLFEGNWTDGVILAPHCTCANLGDLTNEDNSDDGFNSFKNNLGYAVKNLSESTVYAQGNWWGAIDSAVIDTRIYDDEEDFIGQVIYEPFRIDSVQAAEWTMQIHAKTDNAIDTDNYAGADPNATDGFDALYDVPNPPPPPENFINLFFSHPEWDYPLSDIFTRDIRSTENLVHRAKTWDFCIETDQIGQQVQLQFYDVDIPVNYGMRLINLDNDHIINLRSRQSLHFAANGVNHFQLAIGDSIAPVVSLLSPNGGENLSAGQHININWTTSDSSGLLKFILYYTPDDGANYLPIVELPGDRTNYDWVVPSISTTKALIKIAAIDSMFHTADDVNNKVFSISATSHIFNPGWTLMSIPFVPFDNSVHAVFDPFVRDHYYLFNYELEKGYQTSTTVLNGQGYWLATSDTIKLDVLGTFVSDSSHVPLQSGWNLVGHPLNEQMQKAALRVTHNGSTTDFNTAVMRGWLTNDMFAYSNDSLSYVNADTLYPWDGYWTYALVTPLELTFSTPTARQTSLTRLSSLSEKSNENNWDVTLSVRAGGYADLISSLGIRTAATDGFDPLYDNPEPPLLPDNKGIQLYFRHDDWQVSAAKYNSDVRHPLNPDEQKEWLFEIYAPGAVFLSWNPITIAGHTFSLYDMDADQTIDMHSITHYYYAQGKQIRAFKIVVTSVESGIDDQTAEKPAHYELMQNFPNPFNPSTTIRFALPSAEHVTIEVYNILGEKIAVLADEQKAIGYHAVTFDANDIVGGLYLYKIKAGNFVDIRKMLVIK
ncbi:T9SS type A sorting domain-containing protein [candidate division KSB1 bacterium]|nr:T9SS type A sorting domain-containing protein [candidate division KSB1 bacterium]